MNPLLMKRILWALPLVLVFGCADFDEFVMQDDAREVIVMHAPSGPCAAAAVRMTSAPAGVVTAGYQAAPLPSPLLPPPTPEPELLPQRR